MPIALLGPSSMALVARQPPSRYIKAASAGSLVVMASLAVCVGVGYVGLLCAILAAPTLGALFFAAPRSLWVQRALERLAVQRARSRRESARQRALCRVAVGRQEQYMELRGLVEGIERSDPVEALRLELQELLDHFVQLAVAHQRCLVSLRVAACNESQTATPIFEKLRTTQRRDIAARRLRHREETTARLERIVDEIDSADDLIRLVAQRAACAHLDELIAGDAEIDRRLAELDEVEAALVQISA